jgi:hypothetical protein
MTRRRHTLDTKRPRRALGQQLRVLVSCPGCRGDVRIVAYRENTVRFECESCELRFSLDPVQLGKAVLFHPDAFADNAESDDARTIGFMLNARFRGLAPEAEQPTGDEIRKAVLEGLRWSGYDLIQAAGMQPGDTPEERAARIERLDEVLLRNEGEERDEQP